MDFTISAELEALRAQIAHFVETDVLPLESDPASYDEHENIRLDLLARTRDKARAQGLWCLQLKPETGGRGVGRVGMAVCYEEMNRSIFGPAVFNSAAPDDGNMMVMEALGTAEQKEWWLKPVVEGRVRSTFAMTEPAPGGGSDPGMMLTTATRDGDDYVVRGRKWFITGAGEAEHFMLLARTSDDERRGHTCFLFHKNDPGWRITRRIPIMGPEEHGGHCELEFDGLRIPARNVVLEEGRGLKVVQTRLGVARLTHCMRWLGLSKRCIEIATEYADRRDGFGIRLSKRESVQMLIGALCADIEIGRLLVMKAAWELDRGGFAQKEVSMAKVHVANLLHRAADTAIQINGARGYSKDTVAEWIYRYARQARLVDGADEVHRMVLSRHLSNEGRNFWHWESAEAKA
ncbi:MULTISPECIES: acyl-CoA dehydrogenase family protein [unclassified Chelatococcus]|uniref:acyl-CoA dehydrogenase family protein n=1 Tax=unclassified Chelatococcus TaxID=2638111 RepID=UPI001BD14697|nr:MULTISPECIES: acyl-CoA dehydrogenase family protein [unclassified Chelatococcus]CAH1660707.1 Acyl-CoA dehydrogenase [Hyphomicrobiales bacterium]MBS7741153.1 acyl-CoA dehydrogenase family protein [Chelatococcus sp. HY11]MBX3545339.1 acyl-CoA dehydrogenase family protein [Chelatococcus sp.]MCO5077974.1 acyl-CoA dehydrogenase family protein [Chelatococcus sp.]CAH1683330.1 Acyl-CoA dehydrogenase [Hyphomicrobiales bacterium]